MGGVYNFRGTAAHSPRTSGKYTRPYRVGYSGWGWMARGQTAVGAAKAGWASHPTAMRLAWMSRLFGQNFVAAVARGDEAGTAGEGFVLNFPHGEV